jgi:threonine dehydratase
MSQAPTIAAITSLRDALGEQIVRTPVLRCAAIESLIGSTSRVYGKLEFLQRTGTFKARGALATIAEIPADQRAAGVTACSAGNHAIATAFAAREFGISAKIVMISSASPVRVAACREYGAEIILVDDVHETFTIAERIQKEEGRFFVHPFEGQAVATGTGMVGLEICEQLAAFDALIVPVGGGGLIGGVANAVKQLRPDVQIFGVEPDGADSMHRSFAAGSPQSIDKVRTIADSLGAPFAMPYSFSLCKDNVDELVRVDDRQLKRAMAVLYETMQIAVEPACAASTAALLGPLRQSLAGKTVMLVFCGSNIDWDTFASQADFEGSNAN